MVVKSLFDFSGAAEYLPDLTPDVVFVILPEFEGPPRHEPIKLYRPRFVHGNKVLCSAAQSQEIELTRYYNSVMQAAAQHHKQLGTLGYYFWMRPVLLSQGQEVVSFPWYDTYPETANLFQSLLNQKTETRLYDDTEQGWTGAAYATATKICFLEGDEDGNVLIACCTDRVQFQALVSKALVRLQQQMETLVAQLGHNPWRLR